MRELLVNTLQGENGEGTVLSFDYYILIDQMEVNGGFVCESYGIKVSQRGGDGARAEIPNITSSVSRIDELVDLLTRNFVTPSTLMDVVADWL